MAVEQLAAEYAGQPVLLLEHDVDNPVGNRQSRWWAAFDDNYVTLPMVMVSSGHQINNGYLDFYTTYKEMIETDRTRPPQAEVEAIYRRDGDQLHFDVTVTNLSGTDLGPVNNGAVGVIVYEETKVALTGRFVRDNVTASLTESLNAGDSATYSLTSGPLMEVDWNKIRAVAYVEYRPAGSQAFDMLQAAIPVQAYLQTDPESIVALVQNGNIDPIVRTLALTGAGWETWTIDDSGLPSWLTLSQVTGVANTHPVLTIHASQLPAGWSTTNLPISVTGAGVNLQTTVSVRAYLGNINYTYLPAVLNSGQ